jgi:thiol-disulfide isomerase/thioredoxin
MRLLTVLTLVVLSFFVEAQGHRIQFNVLGFKDSIAYLANPYAGKQYIADTILPNADGDYILEGKDTIPPGVYMFVNAEKQFLFQFVIDEQRFTLSTMAKDPTNKMMVTDSPQNKYFFDYWKYVGNLYQEMSELKVKEDEKSKKRIEELNTKVSAFRTEFMESYPDEFITKLLKLAEEPKIPEELNGNDSLRYEYYKKHYFDNIDFSDGRLVRSPLLHDKLMRYLDKMIVPDPDTIVKEVRYVIELAEADPMMFKYVVSQLAYKYEASKQMCVDKVFYDIVDRHFKTGRATWVDEVQMAKILQRGKDLKPCRCGMTGNNLIMQDTTGQFIPLHEVKADYTVVVFWSSTCGHCKSMIPKLKKFHEDYKSSGVEVYGVNIEDESEGYKKYINKMDLDYINVQDTTHATYFRYYYNVYMTPVIYLLDKDKKIVGKQLAVDSVAKLIDQLRDEYDEKKDYNIYYVPSGKDKH